MILLDTHIWIWLVNSLIKKLPQHIISLIESTDELAVSAVSCQEVAWLSSHNRMQLPCSLEHWLSLALEKSQIECIPITGNIAVRSVLLPEHHKDPQDRFIIATALEHDLQVISLDDKFKLYKELMDHLIS